MVLIIYKPKEIKNINRSICLYNTIFFPIMVLGCIIYCLYLGKELTEAFMVEPVNQPYAAQWCNRQPRRT